MSNRSHSHSLFLAGLIAVILPGLARAQTWTGGGSTPNWDDVTVVLNLKFYWNWGGAPSLPASNADVYFAGGLGSGSPVVHGNRQVGSLSIITASPFTLGSPADRLQLGSGRLSHVAGSGAQTISCRLDVGADAVFDIGGTAALTITGIVGGPGRTLTKTGTGTLILTNNNSFSGGATVSAGTLRINNTTGSGTGPGPASVSSDATFGGTGIASGLTTIATNGILAPGNGGGGTITFTNGLTLANNAVLRVEFGSAATDLVRVTGGTITQAGDLAIHVTSRGGLVTGQTYDIADWNGATSSGLDVTRMTAIGPVTGLFDIVLNRLRITVTSQIIYVNAAATGANNGVNWTDAYTDLQSALAAARAGDQIWVAAGSYPPAQSGGFSNTTVSFVLKNGVRIYGGFPASGNPTFADRNYATRVTTLTGVLPGGPWRSYHVVNGSGTNATAVLDGFLVTAGSAGGAPGNQGNVGGGFLCNGGNPTIQNCTFTNNFALVGGAVFAQNASPSFYNCVFYGNNASSGGASGGAFYISGGGATLINCTLAGNSAGSDGGAMGGFGGPVLTNCIVWGNTAPQRPEIGLGAAVTYSCVRDGYAGTGNISQDPQFMNAATGDLRIMAASPCTESGNTAALPADVGDMNGNGNTAEPIPLDIAHAPRVVGTAVDMGAAEQHTPQSAPTPPTGLVPTVVSTTEIDLQWSAHSDPRVTAYNVFRSQTAGFTPSLANRIAANVVATHYNDTGLINGFRYYYRITAFAAGVGESAPSSEVTAQAISVPEIIYVRADAAAGGNGTSWTAAFKYLQSALAVAAADDQIWVAAGTYLPTDGVSSTDPRGVYFQLKSGLTLYGGFPGQPGQEGDPSARDWRTIVSSLSGNIGDPNNPNDNSLHVVSGSGVDKTAVIDGFTITGGAAGGLVATQDNVGGGMRVVVGSPTIRNCTFYKSWALAGGGLFISSGSPLVTNCLFRENYSGGGGNAGAGIYNDAASPTVVNCLFVGNTCREGGGIYNGNSSNPVIVNCTFTKNSAPTRGGAIHTGFSSNATITNCIAWGDTSGFGEISVTTSSTTTVNHSCVQGGYDGTGNFDADPLFRNAAGGDYRLQNASPCFDAGDNAALPAGIVQDLAGNARVRHGTVDVGAYEINPADFDYDSDVDLVDFLHFTACFNGPNNPAAATGCDDADMDADSDVDLVDFLVFSACFNGPNNPPGC